MRIVTFITLLVALPAAAQEAQEPMTLAECMRYAAERAPATQIQQQRNVMARQDYKAAIGALLPTMGVGTSASVNNGRSLGDNNTYVDARSLSNSYNASSNLLIFSGLRGINNVRLQKINRELGASVLDQRRDEAALAAMEAFFNVVYCKKMVVLAAAQLEESSLNLLQTERMEQLGVKSVPEVAEMRAQQAASEFELTKQNNLLNIGIILLKEQMNWPLDEELEIDDNVGGEFSGAATEETAASIYARAAGTLPKAVAANRQLKAAQVALQIAKGQRLPTLSLSGGWSTGFFHDLDSRNFASFASQLRGKRGYYVGASLNIPIFNGFAASTSIKRSRASYAIAQIERETAMRALKTEVERAVTDMHGAALSHSAAARQTEAAAAAHSLVLRQWEEGLVSALELHTSTNRLAAARAAELQSRLEWALKRQFVEYYNGEYRSWTDK